MVADRKIVSIHEVTDIVKQVARPLIWHDVQEPWPKILHGGTCFVLRFDSGLVGVTANHVVSSFEDAQARSARTVCLLRTVLLDLSASIICRDADLDIATFRITEEQLKHSEALAADCRREWPPPDPDVGRELSVCGFPEALKKPVPYDRCEFNSLVNLTKVEDITDLKIVSTYEPARDVRIIAAPELPDLGANWSGCSGGPVLMHVERSGLHRWFPVGLILAGPGDVPEGEMREFDRFVFSRIHLIHADGRIKSPNSGWLPGCR